MSLTIDLSDGYILVSIMAEEEGTIFDEKKASYRRIVGNVGRHRRHQYGVALLPVYFDSIPEVAKVVAEHSI